MCFWDFSKSFWLHFVVYKKYKVIKNFILFRKSIKGMLKYHFKLGFGISIDSPFEVNISVSSFLLSLDYYVIYLLLCAVFCCRQKNRRKVAISRRRDRNHADHVHCWFRCHVSYLSTELLNYYSIFTSCPSVHIASPLTFFP